MNLKTNLEMVKTQENEVKIYIKECVKLLVWFFFKRRKSALFCEKIPKTEVRHKRSATEVKNKIMKVELPNVFWPWEK